MSIVTLNNRALKDATAVGATTALGNLVFISRSTASSSSSLSITSGINSTYKEYIFMFNSMHPATDSVSFQFNGSTDSGSNYNVTKTTTQFHAYHAEADDAVSLSYDDSRDLAQSTDYHIIGAHNGTDNDQGSSGYLHLFEPSSSTFVKHFISSFSGSHPGDYMFVNYSAGYFNTTSAVDAIDFKFSSGNIDSGTIDMYGVN